MIRFLTFIICIILASGAAAQPETNPQPGSAFRDCDVCPEMTVVPAGQYRRGSTEGKSDEQPVKTIEISKPLAVGRFEVTYAEWDACVAEGACSRKLSDSGWGRGRRPVHGATWSDAREYTAWLRAKTGQAYRLPSETEWEYFARAGTQTQYFWGDEVGYGNAVCDDCNSHDGHYESTETTPVGAFKPNAFGLYDVHGNVWEWTLDCYDARAYDAEPTLTPVGSPDDQCKRVMRGGSWHVYPELLRSSRRYAAEPQRVYGDVGFRVVRELAD